MFKHALIATAISALTLTAAGCEDECEPVNYDLADPAPAPDYRNPQSGLCEAFWGGGGGGGGTGCDDIPYGAAAEADQALPDWAQCYISCEGLEEDTCLATSGCRASYESNCGPNELCESIEYTFNECWGTAPSGPVQGGDCTTFDAQECSRHDDCVARHSRGDGTSAVGWFESCAPERTGCYGDTECGEGTHCNAADVCLPPPGAGGPGTGDQVPCPSVCYGYCVPDEPIDPGSCVGEVACDEEPPECPVDTIPGRRNGCWTGFCIPVAQCDSIPACSTLGETDCVSRSDCAPIYQGIDCQCTGTECVCADWLYDSCTAMN
jgi:hypothetical protein